MSIPRLGMCERNRMRIKQLLVFDFVSRGQSKFTDTSQTLVNSRVTSIQWLGEPRWVFFFTPNEIFRCVDGTERLTHTFDSSTIRRPTEGATTTGWNPTASFYPFRLGKSLYTWKTSFFFFLSLFFFPPSIFVLLFFFFSHFLTYSKREIIPKREK